MKQLYTDDGHIVQKSGHDTGRNPHRVRPGALRSMGQSFLAILISLSMALSLTPMGAIAQDPSGAAAPTEAPATADTSAAASDDSPSAAQSGQGTTASSADDGPASSASGSKASSSSASSSSGKSSSGKASSDTGGKSSSDDKKESAAPKSTEGATPTPTDAPDEDKKPAASKTASAGSVTVTVEVGEGVFAEGWTLSASQASTESAQSAIGDPDVQVVAAIDLIVRDKDGNEIGLPAGKTAKVTFSGANAPSGEVSVYRIAGGASRVGTSTATASTQAFSTDSLTPTFAVAAKVAKDDAAYPAAKFSGSANGVTVNVDAPEGALPEGAKMVVTGVGSDDVKKAVEGAIGGEAIEIKAVDITFTDKDDNKIEPKIPVSVSMSGVSAGDGQELHALHVEDGNATEVADAGAGASSATFESGDFSTYVLATKDAAEQAKAAEGEETWTVTFYDHDANKYATVDVVKGKAIGNQMPEVPARDDYTGGAWYVGSFDEYGKPTYVSKVDSSYIPTADTTIIPKYELITYTVTFYEEDKTTGVDTRTVNADSNYSVNDMPTVPEKSGYTGKWVYSGGDFSNAVSVTGDTSVWAEYAQNVFTVNYVVDGATYATDTYYSGDALTLPADPVVEGKQFQGWYVGETEYVGGESVTEDLTITAKFKDEYSVDFVVKDEEGQVIERLSQYFRTGGEAIGTLPQDPFVSGKVFEKWVDEDGTEVTAETVVNGNMTITAVFRNVAVYNIKAEYYYLNDNGSEVIFNTDLLQVEAHEIPYTIVAPSTTQTDPNEVSGAPIYYPETPSVDVELDDFDEEHQCTVRFKYVAYTAEYDFVYMLKDLTGDGYTEIADSREHVYGVLNSYVTPTVKTFEYADLELAEGATITQAEGQELEVKYTRKNYQLSYETNGGSYVSGGTYPYGTSVALSTTVPTRTGYEFAGWYSDEALTQQVTGSVTINANTTLYAKWEGKNVNYTIIYMKEKYGANGNTWVLDNSRDATGKVGNTVSAADAPGLSSGTNGYERDTDLNYEGSSVEIAADGSSVLVVRYKLIRYTVVFNISNGSGEIAIGGQTYTGSNYKIQDVVLGQPIGSLWPSSSTEIYDPVTHYYYGTPYNYYFDGWSGAPGSTYITKQYELIWNHVENANDNHVMTFTAYWSTSTENTDAQYWLQQPDGTWKIADEYTQTGLNTNNLSAKDIAGYTKHDGTPRGYEGSGDVTKTEHVWVERYDDTQNNYGSNTRYDVGDTIEYRGHTYTVTERRNGGRWDWYDYYYTMTCHEEGHYEDREVRVYTYRFYYDRSQYKIQYKYGDTVLRTTGLIYYEADISGAEYNYVPDKPEGKSDYTWGGWYSDSALQQPYTFTTMPAGGTSGEVALVLYAKWIPPTYTVKFVDDDGTTSLADDQTVEKYGKVDKPSNPTKEGYTFQGWYTTVDGDVLFDWNTQITADTTIYAHWTKDILSYTVHYVDESGDAVAPDKTVSNPNLVIGQEVTEQAIAVAGYRPNKNSDTLTLADEGNELTFVYSAKAETTSYTVKYVLDPTEYPGEEIEVAESKLVENVPGNTASVIELAKAADYTSLYTAHSELEGIEFYPDAIEKTLVLTANAENNVYTFYYSSYKNVKVTVNFVDMDGDSVADSDTQVLKVGKTFTLSRTPINGWELAKAVEGTEYSGNEAGDSYKITEAIAADGTLEFTLFYKKKVTVTANSLNKQYDGEALKLPAELSGQVKVEGLPEGEALTGVDFTYANTDNTSNDGRINAGTATVTPKNATTSGSHESEEYYAFRYIAGTLTVTKIAVTIRVEPDRWTGAPYNGTEYKAGFTNASKEVADYILISDNGYAEKYRNTIWDTITHLDTVKQGGAGLGYYGIAKTDAGDYAYDLGFTTANLPENDNYSVNLYVRSGRLQIVPAELTVTTGSSTKAYDGTALKGITAFIEGITPQVAALIEGLAEVDVSEVTIAATGSQTEVGASDNTYNITWGTVKSANYIIKTVNLGTLTVTENSTEITLTAASDSKVYDGKALTNSTVTVSGLPGGFTVEATASGSQTDAGSSANVVNDGYVIRNSAGEDKTANFTNVKKVDGTLTINPKAVTVTAASENFTYDGTAHSNAGFQVDGLVGEDAISATVTGSITFPSESPVTNKLESYEFTTGDSRNYSVTTADGELTMTKASVEITITAASDSKAYDGTPLTNSAVTVTSGELLEGDTLAATATGSATNVADTATGNNPVAAGYRVVHGTEDVTDNYVITAVDGTLTINPKAVTVTAASENFTYDGTAHSNAGFQVDGLVGEDAISATVTGSITFPSESPVTNKLESYEFTTGDSRNYSVTTADGELTMTKASVEITITAASDSKAYDGTPLTNSAVTVTSGELLEGDTLAATATGSATNVADTATGNNPVAAGYRVVHGTEDVTDNYVITAVDGTLTINPKAVTVTAASENFTYDGTAHSNAGFQVDGLVGEDAISATVTGSITFPSESPVTNKLESYEFTTGDSRNYSVTTADGELTMTKASVEITITAASDSKAYDGTPLTNSAVTVTSGELLEGDTLAATATGSATNVADTATGNNPVAAGYRVVHGTEDVTDNYVITAVDGTLTINPKAVTVTAASENFTYDGTAHSNAGFQVDGLVGEDAISATVTGSITFPSESPVTNKLESYEFTTGDSRNYSVTTADGELTMTKASVEITITAASDSKAYDGTPLTNSAVTVTSGELLEGDTLAATATGSATNVADTATGNNPVAAGYRVVHGTEDVTDNYVITAVDGTLTINPKAVTVTAASENFTYDGTAHSNAGFQVDGLVGEDAISATVTGSITFPSESPVTNKLESYEFTTGDSRNYSVTTADGELTMTKASVEITITAASDSKAYDGTPLTNSAVTVTSGELLEGDTLAATATGSATNVADTATGNNPVAAGYRVVHGTEDVTDNYVITAVDGTLTINPKAVTVTAASENFTYDGTAHSNAGFQVDGLVGEDAISATVTGSITFPSESPVTNKLESYEFTTGDSRNYSVTTADGELTMTKASVEITITAASDSKAYDGTPLTNSAVTVTSGELLEGDTLAATATGSATNVADTATGNNPVAAGYRVVHGTEDVTDNYVITAVDGTLTINPKAVTVTAASENFTYDGTAHSNAGFQVDGLVGEDAISATVTGSITFPSESPVTNKLESYEFTTGDSRNYSVTTADGELTMTKASVEITITAASDSKAYDGTPLTNSAVTVTSGELLEGDTLAATATGSATNVADTATGNNPVAAGYRVVHGTEDVTDNYVITAVDGTLTINPKAVTVTAASENFTYDGTAHSNAGFQVDGLVGEDAISATVTGSITFPSESPVTNKLESYEFTTGDSRNYSVTTADGELTMTKASVEITITAASDSKAYDGTPLTNSAVTVTSGELLEGDTLAATATGSATNVADTATGNNPVAAGYRVVHGTEDVTDNYVITAVDGTLTINPKAVTVTAASENFTYDGTAHSNAGFQVDGLVGEDAISATVTGSITFPSESPVTNKLESYEFTTGDSRNYSVTTADGELTMTKASVEITITAASDSKAYDGTPLTNSAVTVTSGELLEGDTLAATATGSATNVADTATGNNPVAAGYRVVHGTEDVTDNYVITAVDGTLTINPKAVTVTAASENFTYDGTAHSNAGFQVDGLVGEDAISATVTGSITFPSESPVTNKLESYEFTTGDSRNYSVTTADGELTMTKASVEITITAASDSKAYDGTPLTNSAVTVTSGELLEGDTLAATATGSATNVADTATGNNPVAAGYRVVHGTEDVTDNYVITAVDGTLTINPKAVTVTAASENFTYDGTAHSNAGFQVDGLVGEDAISATVTGSITFPSESPVTNKLESYEFTTGDSRNYSVTTADGELTMTKASVEITITAASDSKAYDGTPLTNSAVTVTSGELLEGDTLAATATGSATNVADTATGNNPVAAGYRVVHGTEDVTDNYVITAVDGTLTINPKAVTVTAASENFTYDGTAHSNAGFQVDGLVGEDAISATVTGSITFPSESPVTNKLESYEFTTGDSRNYSVTTADGELTMTKASVEITITAASDSKAYDGTPLTNSAVTVTSGELLEGDTLAATATGSATNVADTATGNNPVAAGYRVVHGTEDVTDNYVITAVDGTLTINPKAVTVTAASENFTYDGTAHSNAGFQVDGLVGEDAISATVTGSITFPSESPVTNKLESYEFTTGDSRNYSVTTADGELTMTKASVEITITAASDSKAYDGTPLTNSAVTVTSGELLEGDTLAATATGSATNVADTATGNNPVAAGYRVVHGTEDVTDNYVITAVDGTLTINPKAVTVTAASENFTYDGTAHSNAGFQVDGLVGEDAISATVTGSITFPSESPVTNKLESYEFTTGDSRNYSVTTADGELTMTKASVEITITAASDSKAYDGTPLTNSAVTVTSGELLEGDTLAATATGSATNVADTATGNNPVAAGYRVVHGTEDVTDNYVITAVDGTLTINPKAVTVTAASENFTYDGTAHSNAGFQVDGLVGEDAISATVTGSITFPSESPVTNKLESYEFTTGDSRNYSVTTADGELTMTKASVEITITAASDSKAYDGTPLTNSAVTVTSGELLEGDTLAATATGSATNVADTATGNNPVAAGYRVVHGTEDVTDNYVITAVDGTLTINPKAVTVTAASENFTYDGTAHSNAGFQVDGLVGEDAISATVTGSITFPSESPVTNKLESYEFTTGDSRNYSVTTADGELTMTKASVEITITAASDSKAYDGTPLTNSAVTVTSGELLEGDTLAATATGSATNVADTATGNNPVAAGYRVVHGTEDVTDNYVITAVDGTLTINPKAVTVTAASENFTYDGTAHSNAGFQVDGLVGEDAISATVTGSITFPSESPVTNKLESYEFTTGDSRNYSVTTADGELTMTKASVEITITAASDSKAYDGTPLTNSAVTVTSGELLEGDTLAATATGSATNVADTATGNNPVAAGYRVVHGTEDVTDNYVITAVDGTLTINPKAVTVTAASENFTYDGTAHSNAGFQVDGLVGEDAISATVTGSITFPSESPVTNKLESYEFTTGDSRNYSVTTADGELTMTKASVEITITAASDSKAYDGTPLTNSAVTVTSGELLEGDTLAATATGSATNVADTATGNNPVAAGYRVVHGTEDVTDNYVITAVDGTLTINPKAVTVTAASENFTYDGTAHSNAGFQVDGLVGEDAISATVTGSITFPSESPVTNKLESYEFTTGDSRNYSVTTADGELTMTKASVEITITAASDSKAYDGTPLTNSAVTVTSGELLEGDTLAATATGSATNVADTATGNNPVAAGYRVVHGTEDVTDNYVITAVDGTLTINPKAVTVTAASENFTYDGTAHSNAGFQVDGLVGEDAISATVTGSITFPSESPVTNKLESYEFTTGDSRNYSVTTADGELTMTKASVEITITAASDSKAYDGTPLTNSAVTVTSGELLEGDTLAATATGSATNVADTATGNNPVAAGYRVVHGTEDVTDNYVITAVDGTLTINPKAVTVTAASENFTYDGTAHSNAGFQVDGLVGEDAISATVTGSITFPSESPVTNKLESYEFTTGDSRNYSVTTADGELTMTKASVEITITAASDSKAYDGTPLTNSAVTVTSGELLEGDTLAATATGSATNVADTATGNNPVAAGYRVVHGTEDVTDNYVITAVDGTLTINPKAVTVTAASENFTYDGTAHSNAGFQVDGLVGEDAISATVTGSITFPSESPVTNKLESYEFTTGDSRNYSVTTADGELTMTKASVEITITAASDSKAYDGTPLTNSAVTVTSGELLEGDTLAATATGSATNVADTATGNNPVAAGYRVVHGTEDVTDNYVITAVDGTLTINPKAVTVTITGHTDTKPYNGCEQKVEGYEATADSDLYDVTKDFTFSGEAVAKGTNVNTYPMGLAADQFANDNPNFDVTFSVTDGELEIAKAPLTVTVKPQTYTYNGEIQGPSDIAYEDPAEIAEVVAVDGLQGSDALTSVIVDGQGQDVGGYPLVASSATIGKATGNYDIKYVDGLLTIEPAEIAATVNGSSETKVYNGSEQTYEGIVKATSDDAAFDPSNFSYTGDTVAKGTEVGDYTTPLTEEGCSYSDKNYKVKWTIGDPVKLTITSAEPKGQISVAKEVTSKPSDGMAYKPGEPITYKITATNTGSLTLTNVKIDDPLTKESWTVETLASDAKVEYTTSYTVTDADAGKVTNTATATGKDPSGNDVTGEASAEAQVVYTITYKLNGGTYDGSTADIVETYAPGTEITIHDAPTRDGYTFTYWKGSEYQPGDKYTVTEDHTFVAQWKVSATPAKQVKTAKTAKSASPKTGDTFPAWALGAAGLGMLLLTAGVRLSRREKR